MNTTSRRTISYSCAKFTNYWTYDPQTDPVLLAGEVIYIQLFPSIFNIHRSPIIVFLKSGINAHIKGLIPTCFTGRPNFNIVATSPCLLSAPHYHPSQPVTCPRLCVIRTAFMPMCSSLKVLPFSNRPTQPSGIPEYIPILRSVSINSSILCPAHCFFGNIILAIAVSVVGVIDNHTWAE